MLMSTRRFFEYTLYLFFDDTAVSVMNSQYNVTKECDKIAGNCEVGREFGTIEYLIKTLVNKFASEGQIFDSIRYGHYSKVNRRLVVKEMKFFDNTPKSMQGPYERGILEVSSSRTALDLLINDGLAHSDPDDMTSSFSVVAVVNDNDAEGLKKTMNKFKPSVEAQENNGKLLHPIFISVIPVDEKSTLLFDHTCPLEFITPLIVKGDNIKDRVTLLPSNVDELFDKEAYYNNVYSGYDFQNRTIKGTDFILPMEEEAKALKGASSVVKHVQRELKHYEYEFYFGFNKKLGPTCSNEKTTKVTPIEKKVHEAVLFTSVALSKSYVVNAACVNIDKPNRENHSLALYYHETLLKEFKLPKHEFDDDEPKKYCELLSLYENVPTTLHHYKKPEEEEQVLVVEK